MKKVLKVLLFAIAIIILVFAGLIIFVVVSDYRPPEKKIIAEPTNPSLLKDTLFLSLLSWNIGYAGLDRDMDFFYDGGTKVFTPEARCNENIADIKKFLQSNDTVDFVFLQEVDRKSKRSYRNDEYKAFSETLTEFNSYFALNYKVPFVPSPVHQPMGKVLSGIAIFSKYIPESSVRYSLPGNLGFPTQLFYLDRCFMVNRYKIDGGKQLVVINTHNEAFDAGGEIRKAQMQKLKEFMLNEYIAGNFVITGGDWNQYPPDFKPSFTENKAFTGQIGNFNLVGIEADYMPADWKWIYDPTTPSVRTLMAPYDPEVTPTSVCDIFLVSPNIESVSVRCCQLGFANSDHNPVIVKIKLH